MVNDKTKSLYEALSKDGYNVGTYENFTKNIQDEGKRKSLYDAISADYSVGDYDSFSASLIGKQDDVSVQAPAPAVPENPAPFTMDAKVRDYVLANKPGWLEPQPLATAPLGPDYTPLEDTEKRFEVAEKVRPYMIKEQNKGALRTLEGDLSALRNDLTAKMKAEKDDSWNLPAMRSDVGAALLRQTKSHKYESKEALQLQNVEYAEKLLDKSKRLLEEGENPSTSFMQGFGRGFSDSMSDLDKWTMGWSDLENNLRVQDIVRKIEKGQTLDASEQAVMDAMVTNAATEMLYREGLGRGYKAGEVTGESLPFMLDMIGSMGVIQSTTRPLSRAMMKYATSKLRQMGVKSGSLAMTSGRGLAHLGSGATNLALHTATAGAPRVAADYAQRGIGQTEIDFKPSGNAVYKGQSGQESGASAFGKAVISTAAETGSELLGEKFMPLLGYLGRVTGVNKIGNLIPKRIGELASDIASNPAVKEVMGFAKAAKISDPISEYAEEVVNNLVSVGIGDMSIDQLTDINQNIDTFLGVAPISVLFGGAGAGAYIRSKYKVNKEMKNFERKMSENHGEDWTEIRNALQNSTIEEARNFVKDILSRNDLSKAEKKDMVRYVYANMQEQTLSSSDVVVNPEEIEANKREIFNAYQVASKRVPFLTDEDKAKLPMMSVEEIESMDMPDDVKDRVVEYKAALEDYNRYIELTNARVQMAREQAIAQVEELTNYSTGTVMRVKSGFSENPVHILRGKVTFNDKGEVDASRSDKVIYYMTEDGSVKMGSTSMIQELIDETDASALAEQAANDAQADVEAQETAETSPVEVDTTIQSGDTSYYVQAKNPDGTYLVSVTTPQGEQIAQMTEQQLQDLITTQQAVQVDEMSQQTAESATTTQNVESTVQNRDADNVSNFEETLPRDDKGNFDFAAFTPQQAYQYTAKMSGEDVAREDLQADVNNLQAEIDKLTEQAKKAQGGKRIQIRQEIADKMNQLNSMTELLNSVTPAETVQEAAQEEVPQEIVQEEVQAEPTAYEDMDSYDTLADLNKDLSEEEVDAFVANNIKEYESQLGKVKAPKIGTDKAAYLEEKKAVEAEKAEIQRKIDYWKGIQGEITEMRSQIGEKEAQEILSQDEPQTAEEYAALKLGGGAIKLNRDSYLKETGYENEEAKKMFGLFSKDGVSVERAGEMLEEEAKEDGYNFFAEGDVNAGRAAVLNVLSEARTRGDLINYIKNRRQAQEERQMNAERAYYEDMIERNFNMTAEEYEQYIEVAEREISKRMLSEEDYNEFMSYFADETLNETEDGRKETDIERSEAGGEVLQGEQPDNAGGSTEVEKEPTEVDGGGDNAGNVAPEATVKESIEPNVLEEYNPYDFAYKSKGKKKSIFNGVYFKNGTVTSSDFYVTVRRSYNYPPEYEGKIVDKNKNVLNGTMEIEKIIPKNEEQSVSIDIEYLKTQRDLLEDKIRKEWEEDGSNGSYKDFRDTHNVGIKIGNAKRDMVFDAYNSLVNVLEATNTKSISLGDDKLFYKSGNNVIVASLKDYIVEGDNVDVNFSGKSDKEAEIKEQPTPTQQAIQQAESEVNTEPTEGQKEAGNYKMGHVKVDGMDITIENPKGSTRSGVDVNGKEWSVTMNNTYGYIRGTRGVDGDHIDIFLSDNPESGNVYVIDQVDQQTGIFDESKVMYGFGSMEEARDAYLSNYEEGWKAGVITEVSKEEFKKWLDSSTNKIKPFSEYSGIEKVQTENDGTAKDIKPVNGGIQTTESVLDYAKRVAEREEKKSYGSQNKVVSTARYEELRKKLRSKLNNLNAGYDPELFQIGAEMAAYHVEAGARKFADFAKRMLADIGEEVRPYLKLFYNGVRDFPGMESYEVEMDPYEEVRKTDINSIKLEEDEQTEENAESVAGKAEAVANEAESRIEDARTEDEINDIVEQLDEQIEDVNKQLSELDYIDTLNSGMRVVLKDGRNVLLSVVMHSGEQISATQFSKPHVSSMYASYKGKLINIMPEDVDIDATIKYNTPKQESELAGDSSEYQDKASQEKKAVEQIGLLIREKALSAVDGNSTEPLSMKDVKKILGGYSLLSDMSPTDMQELVELAMTNETRKVALKYIAGNKQKFGYDLILAMYNAQPLLNARDSTRFERQQYSTPTPFGYVMGQFVQDGKQIDSVLEPSAGNGALTITFPSAIVHVNDIDDRRLANLRTIGYREVTNQDALVPFNESVDAVMTNPPFGITTTKEFDGGRIKINSLEGLMAINALESMKDDGRAAIVIGGNTSYRDNGAMQSKDMRLFSYLYTHYNVVDVINLDGDMYKRNGTKCDVRIILINGRKKDADKIIAPPVKSKARAEQVKTFEELYNRVQDDIHRIQQMGTIPSSTEGETESADGKGIRADGNVSNSSDTGERRGPGYGSEELGSENNMESTEKSAGESNERKRAETAEGLDNINRPDKGNNGNVSQSIEPAERGGHTEGRASRAAGPDATDRGDNSGRSRLAVNLGDEKVAYPNRSQSGTLMSVVPANQAKALADSLEDIGDVDQFLVNELGYSSKEELFGYLAAEQIDSVSLAINQMNKGNGFIIGDMTGVGKGRQGAALIRYAVRKGYKPIYFTQKPALFSDNYRDLADIGSGELRPFIIGSDPKNAAITDAQGNVIHKLPTEKERKRVYDYILKNGTLPDEYDYVITTYSQINNGTKEYEATKEGITAKDKTYKKKSPSPADKSGQERRDVLKALSKNNIMILDESHTAGGSGGGSMFMQYIMPRVKGVTFLSATFAKRAENMPIYAMKTDLAKSGITQQELIEAIAKGGVTLQEIMSKQLVQSGQMIRRERSFNGVTIDWLSVSDEEDAVQRKQFDEVSSIFSAIRSFQKEYVNTLVENLSEELAEEGGYSDLQRGTVDLGASNTPFASKMYNLVNQLLFSLKADAVANRVIENLKNGFKPVISFTNTMEGFLDEAPKDTPMDVVPNFSLTLLKALDGVMRYTETDIQGEKINKFYTPDELGEEGKKKYYEIKNKIEHLSANLPISPMDAIKTKIEEAGYKVGEITGRNLEMVRNEEGKYIVRNRKDKDKKSAARDFNNGQIDVLMINKSGSTGISLHASPKFHDQRQRVMVFAQFQSDINDEVQMRGRIDRTGQIYRGKYEYIMSSIPAEQRLQMMFKAKLKSLDANTTSSQKSKFNEMQVTDFLNKYGDEVVYQYMIEHPELSEKLGDPLNMLADNGSEMQVDETSKEKMKDSAAKIARYLPFLPVKEQEEVFKEITDAYAVKIQLLNDAGENDLEITTMPLKAKTLSRKIWNPGAEPNSGNAFADNTYIEEVEVDVLKKPMKSEEIKKESERLSEGKPFEQWIAEKKESINKVYEDKVESLKAKLKKSTEERIAKAKETYIKKSKEARDKGKNEFTDDEIIRMSNLLAEDIKAKANEGFAKQKNAIDSRRDNVLKAMEAFEPMKPLIIPTNLEEETATIDLVRGMFVGFKFSKDYSPSSSTAVFATLDGRRKVEIPLKDSEAFGIIRMNTLMQPSYLQTLNIDTWDSFVPTQTRKRAYIVTGNLLQALVDVKKSDKARGYLVSYSTEEGDTKQGMLMSEGFQPSDLTTSVPIRSRLEQVRRGETVVSEDKRVVVEKNVGWRGGFSIKVPKSKKQGGEFFEDKVLRSLVNDKEFTSKGNFMVGEFGEYSLPKLLDRLSNMGVKVSDKAKLKDAPSDVRFRSEREQGAVESTKLANEIANDTATKLGVPITVHDAIDSVPEGPAKEAIKKGRKVKGWYDTKTGTVHVYMPNATSAEDVQKTILHEGVAHYGLRHLVGEEYFDDFLDEVFANVSQGVRGRIVSNLPKYGYNSRVATEEYMATLAENGVEPSVWNRIKQAFKELLRKVGIKVSISDNELKYILWRSAQNLRMNNPLDLVKDVAMQYNMGVGNYSPDTFFREDDAIEAYNQFFNKKAYWFKEAWQDSMLALKNLQGVVAESSGEPIKDFENAYMAENQLRRLNKAQSIKFWDEYMQPLANEVAKMVSKDVSYQDIIDYLMLSHGIERNVEMSNRERINDMDEQDREAAYEQFYNDVKALRRQYKGYDYLKVLTDYFGEVDDYSATEAILSRDGNEHTDFQNEALERVREFEASNDVTALRKLIKAATDQSLRKTFESGMMGRDEYNRVKDMFAYYVPLRGWEGTKAEDVYDYMGDMNPVNSTLKKMKGRNSIPDDPIATIGNMGESAIVQGNRNAMKQKFYNMAVNHPTDLITMTKAWYAPNANGDMELSLPQIDETDNAETIAQKIKDHDELMKSIGATRKKQGLNISYPITSSSKTQHAVIVKIGGKDYVLYINGNPRAAQAINGLTNPDAETNPALKATYWLNRTLSALYTSKNPEFVVSNFMRDYIEACTVISAKEDSDYNKAFRKNMRTALVDVAKGFKGKLKGDANKYFTEFTENGGQMGYFSISDVNAYKKKLKKQMDEITGRRGSAKKALDYIWDSIEAVNKYAETVSRYATYRTSREMGRSIEQSIKDASDVTVNFSKKGSGFKAMGGKIVKGDISTFIPKAAGFAAGSAKMLYLFINPAIQSLANWGYIAKRNKKAIMGIVGGFALSGYVMPIINQVLWSLFGDDDRENPYNDLPEWIRRNNICIGVGTYLTIPLPHTLRAFYDMGEMSYQVSTGRKDMSPEKMTYEVASQLTALLPIDPLGNDGDIKKTLTPSYLRGMAEAYIWNEDFMGTPIAKITPYNENDPEWKRVYKGTAGWLVDTSKFFNDLSAGKEAGRDFRKGVIDFNPAKMEHIGESYFGGIWKFLNNAGKTIYYTGESLIEGEKSDDLVLRNVPWVRRFLATSDERTSFSGLNDRYYDLVDEMEQFKYELDGVKRSIKDDPEKYTWQYEELMKSDDYKKYKVYEGYRNALDNLYKISKSVSDEEKKQIENYSNGLKRQLLEELK